MVCICFIGGAMFNKTPKQTTVNPLYKVHTLCAIEIINTFVNTDFDADISVKYGTWFITVWLARLKT